MVQLKPLAQEITPIVQRQVEEEEEEEEELIQPKRNPGASLAAPRNINDPVRSLHGGGRPMDTDTRGLMERRFGYDFSKVRIHTDNRAADAAGSLQAQAFTIGKNIAFGSGQYTPRTDQGRRLLAHELTHVVQQNSGKSKLTKQKQPGISVMAGPQNMISRWKVTGNTATSDSNKDTLWNLAKSITGSGKDWACIWPIKMQTSKSLSENYHRYIMKGDTFDISFLTAESGVNATIVFYKKGDPSLEAIKAFYGGMDAKEGELDIEELITKQAIENRKPIEYLELAGHIGNNAISNGAEFSPSEASQEKIRPHYYMAHIKEGPRRCWFTRNAIVRIVGCESRDVAAPFAKAYLRSSATAYGTTQYLCGWEYKNSVLGYVFTFQPKCDRPRALPLYNKDDIHGRKDSWEDFKGKK